jgi:hypothetical protein
MPYQYTGGVVLDHNGHFARNQSVSAEKYVGTPSPEIDDAWEQLLNGLNVYSFKVI